MSGSIRLHIFAFNLALIGWLVGATTTALAQTCPFAALATAKSNILYLYYPTAQDTSFPNWTSSGGVSTSPLEAFNITDLDSSIGTAAQLRLLAEQFVAAGYCEFDVDVRTVTAAPTPSEPRWQIVGIGSDDNPDVLVGIAQDVDTNDTDAQDYARFWVAALADFAGAELTGANSTLERWATGMANLIAHESGHNYGGTHGGGVAVAGEDTTPNHFMTNPALGATASSVIDSFNHFSDTSYEVLAHNIGLNVKTLSNWDFVNPNDSNADSLVIKLLSNAPSLTIGWSYSGGLSPWQNPTVADTGNTATYRGTSYKVYELTFSTPKAWSGGANGIAPPDVKFHVGASFTQSDPIVVYEATLRSGGADLSLHPRIIDFDAGTTFAGFAVSFANTTPEAGFMELRNLRIVYSPRMIDIESMMVDALPIGLDGRRAAIYERERTPDSDVEMPTNKELSERVFRLEKEPIEIPVALLTDKRHIDYTYGPKDCERREFGTDGSAGFGPPGTALYCPKGTALSLYPATYVYVTATLVEPNAKHWDPRRKEMVEGPIESQVFFQVGGMVPDANGNGIDDLLDIRSERFQDRDRDGVPDEVKGRTGSYPARKRPVYSRR